MSEKNLPSVVAERPAVLGQVSPPEEYSLRAYADGLEAKLQVCDLIVKSGTLPHWIKSREALFAVITTGAELGFSPMQSTRYVYLVNGKPSLESAGMLALCRRAGGRFKTLEDTPERVTVQGWRGEETEVVSFSIEEAKRADLLKKDTWQKHPRDMLYAKCVGRVCRRLFSDVIGGLWSREELESGDVIEPELDLVSRGQMLDADIRSGAIKPIGKPTELRPTDQDKRRYAYDISHIEDSDLYGKVAEYLTSSGAVPDEATGYFFSAVELKKTKNYLVTPPKEGSSDE